MQRYVRLDGLDGLDAIWISHLHADHRADLLTACHGALSADVRLAAPIPLHGPPGMPAFALRADAGGRSMVYSGDTAPRAALTGLAADGDLLPCEAEAVARAASRFAGPVGHADPGAVLTV
ncbi:hypothetical protein ACFWXO_06370 [Kitasatospora sp. NPDC059088]|uniref:hypothetical protein n=1 Tax=Kitasatospora sp. NPDC059088 TaxID=3346722 RepID=UPI00368D1FD5